MGAVHNRLVFYPQKLEGIFRQEIINWYVFVDVALTADDKTLTEFKNLCSLIAIFSRQFESEFES